MESKPKLRVLEIFAVEQDGKRMVALRDPAGLFQGAAIVSQELFHVAALLDGTRSLEEVRVLLETKAGLRATIQQIEDIANNLDHHFLLENERFQNRLETVIREFAQSPVRPAYHAGQVYPETEEQAREQMKTFFQNERPKPGGGKAKALLAPHIDYFRGGETYSKTYAAIREIEPPDLFVVLATSHGPTQNLLCLTLKDYETPFGPAKTDKDFIRALGAKLPGTPFRDEICHRTEHAAEFQIHFLKYLFPDVPVAPILCGGLRSRIPEGKGPHESAEINQSVDALRGAMACVKNPFLILGVDLAHVGPRFGDTVPLDEVFLNEVKKGDLLSLDCAGKLDAEGFYRAVVDGDDPRRVCGLSPIYLGLRAMENLKGDLIEYRQCTSEDQSVTIAGMAFS